MGYGLFVVVFLMLALAKNIETAIIGRFFSGLFGSIGTILVGEYEGTTTGRSAELTRSRLQVGRWLISGTRAIVGFQCLALHSWPFFRLSRPQRIVGTLCSTPTRGAGSSGFTVSVNTRAHQLTNAGMH